ncbi:hypothetical protein L1987_47857 [Smallanthus sonchifolius]|uniref:Uncharacterized protein n=1 Tax=Smallanthus sonchifolius TaxID=185202 RepID=A0ACB9FQD3_9ASTR|nr:hypothetical protein L1987_47857 [Smallanthus sonchifolius]
MQEQLPCQVVCRIMLDAKSAKDFKEMIDNDYRVNMYVPLIFTLILDNLPVAVLRQRHDDGQPTFYQHGFPVGFKGTYINGEKYFINNHLSFRVLYHKNLESNSARIVGFEVTPVSRAPQTVDRDKDAIFTYDVVFKESDIEWASRWDVYVLMNDDQLHWFSIINSLIVILFLSGMLAMIMMRILYKEISNYNQFDPQNESEEETGWKVVHGDVFRAPTNSGLLCVHVGTGVQIFGMTLTAMIFALLGFLSPSNRGSVITAMVLLWAFMGLFAGFASARLYKALKGTEWKKNALKTSVMFPGILFAVFFVLNAFIWGEHSSGAVPFGTMFALVCLWLGISVPLVFVGSYLAFNKPITEDPVKTNKIPRQVPKQPCYAMRTTIGGGGLIWPQIDVQKES